MGVTAGPNFVKSGLTLYLDAANSRSYPGSGTTWTDISGNNNTGTLVNGPTFNSNNSGSIVFDGTNDYFTAGSTLPSGTNLFTISVWLYYNANITGKFGPTIYGSVISSGNSTGTMEYIIGTSGYASGPPYQIFYECYNGATTGTCKVTNINMPILTWHNLVLVRDGAASQKIYLNGTQIGTGNVSNNFTAGTLYVGGAPAVSSYTGYFNGKISNFTVHNVALTADQIMQDYNALRFRFGV